VAVKEIAVKKYVVKLSAEEGSGANKLEGGAGQRPRPTRFVLLRCQQRMPDGRRTSAVEAQLAEVELSLLNPAQQFNTGNCDRCGLEALKP